MPGKAGTRQGAQLCTHLRAVSGQHGPTFAKGTLHCVPRAVTASLWPGGCTEAAPLSPILHKQEIIRFTRIDVEKCRRQTSNQQRTEAVLQLLDKTNWCANMARAPLPGERHKNSSTFQCCSEPFGAEVKVKKARGYAELSALCSSYAFNGSTRCATCLSHHQRR